MEQKIKVGDRVNVTGYGHGKIIEVFTPEHNFPYAVEFDSGLKDLFCEHDGRLSLIDTDQTAAVVKYDRAMIAAMAMQGLIQGITWMDANDIICTRPQDVAEIATVYADALIAELQKPKP